MPKTLADARIKLVILTTKPTNLAAISATALTAGIAADTRILKSDYRLSPTASDTVNEAELSASGNATVWGNSNYEGSVTPFRYLDETGATDLTADVVFQALKEKGTTVWLVEREGPPAGDPWAAGDEYEVYEVLTDTPQKPTDRTSGYIKRIIPLGVQNRVEGVVTGA
jgi:hypothetical protein